MSKLWVIRLPRMFRNIIQHWIDEGLSQSYIRDLVSLVRDTFRWGVVEGLVHVSVYQGLQLVGNIDQAKPACKVDPVDKQLVRKTCRYLSTKYRMMIWLQYQTGCRPGELLRITKQLLVHVDDHLAYIDLDQHKTAHHGRTRRLHFGRKALAILTVAFNMFGDQPFMLARHTYGMTIRRVLIKEELPRWTPNQLRHTRATELRKMHGIEHVKALLGHTKLSTTEIYAERDYETAAELIRKAG